MMTTKVIMMLMTRIMFMIMLRILVMMAVMKTVLMFVVMGLQKGPDRDAVMTCYWQLLFRMYYG